MCVSCWLWQVKTDKNARNWEGQPKKAATADQSFVLEHNNYTAWRRDLAHHLAGI
jgi:hypothetical protein